jgi:hypothetical protein
MNAAYAFLGLLLILIAVGLIRLHLERKDPS